MQLSAVFLSDNHLACFQWDRVISERLNRHQEVTYALARTTEKRSSVKNAPINSVLWMEHYARVIERLQKQLTIAYLDVDALQLVFLLSYTLACIAGLATETPKHLLGGCESRKHLNAATSVLGMLKRHAYDSTVLQVFISAHYDFDPLYTLSISPDVYISRCVMAPKSLVDQGVLRWIANL